MPFRAAVPNGFERMPDVRKLLQERNRDVLLVQAPGRRQARPKRTETPGNRTKHTGNRTESPGNGTTQAEKRTAAGEINDGRENAGEKRSQADKGQRTAN